MSRLQVSDHALLRFLERGGGLDVEALRARLSDSFQRAHAAAQQAGGGDYLISADDLTYVVRGGVMTTVLPHGGHGASFRALDREKR